jgi:hypothetical protein
MLLHAQYDAPLFIERRSFRKDYCGILFQLYPYSDLKCKQYVHRQGGDEVILRNTVILRIQYFRTENILGPCKSGLIILIYFLI